MLLVLHGAISGHIGLNWVWMDRSPGGVRYRAHYTNLRVLETDPRVVDANLRGYDTDPRVMDTKIINIWKPLFDRRNKMFGKENEYEKLTDPWHFGKTNINF